jgi:hypothetical protein
MVLRIAIKYPTVINPDCKEDSPASSCTSASETSNVPAAPLSKKLDKVAPEKVLFLKSDKSTKLLLRLVSIRKKTIADMIKMAQPINIAGLNQPSAEPWPITMFNDNKEIIKETSPAQSKDFSAVADDLLSGVPRINK